MASKKWLRLGELLLRAGVIDEAQLESALRRQREWGGRLGRHFIALGQVSHAVLGKALARQHGLPFVDLERLDYDLSLLDFIPERTIRAAFVLPIQADETNLFVLLPDPKKIQVIDEISFLTGKKVRVSTTSEELLESFIEGAFEARRQGETVYRYASREVDRETSEGIAGRMGALFGEESRGAEPLPGGSEEVPLSLDELGERRAGPQGKRTVLVVDDDPAIRKALGDYFRKKGFEVRTAEDGAEAVQILKVESFNLLILDCMLPGIHGFEICRHLKRSRRFKDLPVIMISAIYRGWRTEGDLMEEYGVEGFLPKPFTSADLERKLSRVESLKSESDRAREAAERREAVAAISEGIEAYRSGDWAGAREIFIEALRYDQLFPEVHFYLGEVDEKLGRSFEALDHYEKAIQMKPEFFQALRKLAVLYEKLGFANKAFEMWERAARATDDERLRSRIKAHLLEMI